MRTPLFRQLNHGWNADPNGPEPEVRATGSTVELSVWLNGLVWPADAGMAGRLRFGGCARWRLGPTNDHGWHAGQCRYGRLAPAWGEFYEIKGADDLRLQPSDWHAPPAPGTGDRHFLFYLRDHTFECLAADWQLDRLHGREPASSGVT